MQILLYSKPSYFPEGPLFVRNEKSSLLGKEEIEKMEEEELRDFLLAILSFNFLLTAHVVIQNDTCYGGEVASLFFSVAVQDGRHAIVFNEKSVFFAQGAIRFSPLHFDVTLEQMANPKIFQKKSYKEWVEYFKTFFEEVKRNNLANLAKDQAIVNALSFNAHLPQNGTLLDLEGIPTC